MKFVDFVSRDAIRTNVDVDSKEQVIRSMASALQEAGKINQEQFESIVEAILKREELGSTGIGRGVAVPHTKHPSVKELVGAMAVSDSGVDFDSLDGEKVHLLFMLVSPPIVRATTCVPWKTSPANSATRPFAAFSSKAKPEDVWLLLEEADNNQFV